MPNTKEVSNAAFVYLSLANDPQVMAVIRDLQIRMDNTDIKWELAPTLHVTMVFAPDADYSSLLMASQSIHMMMPLRIHSDSLGIFENGDERALHLKVTTHELLSDLQRTIFGIFDINGIEQSSYSLPADWNPHITLAYLPRGIDAPVIPVSVMTMADKLIVSRSEYQPFAEIEATQVKSYLPAESRIYKDYPSEALRLMMIVTSNAYKDREGEIITEQALGDYVDSCWKEGDFVGDNPLLVWHGGDAIGDIIYAEMSGPFLIEIARERPNKMVNLSRVGEAPIRAMVKSVWDGLEHEDQLGASHEFAFFTADRSAGIYQRIMKTETSVLPRLAAANLLTDGEILKGVQWEQ